eukprot:1126271-Amphidinium_carterae.1
MQTEDDLGLACHGNLHGKLFCINPALRSIAIPAWLPTRSENPSYCKTVVAQDLHDSACLPGSDNVIGIGVPLQFLLFSTTKAAPTRALR